MNPLRRLICLLILTLPLSVSGHDGNLHRVLFISSYSPGFPSFNEQLKGIRSVLTPDHVQLDIEILDAKRFGHLDSVILNALEYKIGHLPPYELIITGDDAATQFATQRRYGQFAGIPIVFLGVNDLEFGLYFNDDPQVTGVLEKASFGDNLILIQDLLGTSDPITVITDNTPSGQSDVTRFIEVADNMNFDRYRLFPLADHSYQELIDYTATLELPSAILLLSAFLDKNGVSQDYSTTLQALKNAVSVPIFDMWRHGLGNGVFGGRVISHFEQGRLAASQAEKIIRNIPVDNLQIISENANLYAFDYNEITRFGFTPEDMPRTSEIINLPPKQDHTGSLLALLGTLATILLITSLVLLFRMRLRNQVERKMMQANEALENKVVDRTQALEIARLEAEQLLRLRDSILDNSFAGIILVKNNQIEWVNHYTETLFGYKAEELIRQPAEQLYKDLDSYIRANSEEMPELAKGNAYRTEINLKHKNGKMLWCILSSKALDPGDLSQGIIYIGTEITERKLIEEELKVLNQKLTEQATTDHLTGLFNRRHATEQMQNEIQRSLRYDIPLSIILLDIDLFKAINDEFGHDVGDSVLRDLGKILKATCRNVDMVARWGGEEFLLLCPSTSQESARKLAELLRKRIESHRFKTPRSVTASFGISTWSADQTLESLLKNADNALYYAKRTRNCVQVMSTHTGTVLA